MKKLLNAFRAFVPSAVLVLGAVAVSFGVGLIYVPAGVITAGLLTMAGGVLLILGGGDSHE